MHYYYLRCERCTMYMYIITDYNTSVLIMIIKVYYNNNTTLYNDVYMYIVHVCND